MNWNKIWKKNKYLTNLYPSNNIVAFYEYHLSNLNQRSKILDCGCGSGRNFKYLTEKKFNVIGTDTSKDIINKNKKNFLKYKNNFYLGDIRTLNFKENYFDAIISDASLYYQSIEDIRETIDKFYYILKPDRFLRIYTKSIYDNFFKSFNKGRSAEHKVNNKNHWEYGLKLSFLNKKDINSMFRKFSDLKIGFEDFNYIDLKKKHSFFIITARK